MMIGEIQKRPALAKLLAHEDHRDLRREQQHGDGGAQRLGMRQAAQPFAKRAVADLVVILQSK